ncbi:MAG TPA: TerD family protein [Allosphingosinicella sp.]|jgi:tellurite resistance protein TerA
MQLQRGANTSIGNGAVRVAVEIGAGASADVSAYLLNEAGKVRGDHDMVFFNQPSGGDGSVRLADGRFDIDLDRVPAEIARIVFCVTVDQAQGRQSLSALASGGVVVTRDGGTVAEFRPDLGDATEAAMTFGELYRRGGEWKFRAVGQGFNGGLAPLARSFGIDVADDPAPAPPPPAPPPPAPVPPPAPASPPISLSKVSLEKKGQAVSLQKRGASFGQIVVNLNWSRGKKGFFSSAGAIDLDLGCLLEMQDGRKSVVQALGRMFGAYNEPPYIALDGDDRTGDVSMGENMRINGAHWSEIRRVAVFANIYDGVPNWQQTDGVVSLTMPDQPPIEVRMTEGRNDKRLCGIVLLENDGGQLKATRIVDYFRDQSELDHAYGWGLRWVAGSKD